MIKFIKKLFRKDTRSDEERIEDVMKIEEDKIVEPEQPKKRKTAEDFISNEKPEKTIYDLIRHPQQPSEGNSIIKNLIKPQSPMMGEAVDDNIQSVDFSNASSSFIQQPQQPQPFQQRIQPDPSVIIAQERAIKKQKVQFKVDTMFGQIKNREQFTFMLNESIKNKDIKGKI